MAAVTRAEATVGIEAKNARRATKARDAAICAMHDEGATLRAIAAAAGMGHSSIRRVLARRPKMEETGQ